MPSQPVSRRKILIETLVKRLRRKAESGDASPEIQANISRLDAMLRADDVEAESFQRAAE